MNNTPGATGVYVAELLSNFDSGVVNGSQVAGSISTRVFRNTGGFLDFFYQLNITTATAGVTAVNLNDFTGFDSAGAYGTASDIDGTGPFTAGGRRPFAAQRVGTDVVAFAFNSNARAGGNDAGAGDGALTAGTSSSVLSVRTNATAFNVRNAGISSGATANAGILSPTAAAVVPEAGTLALLLPGMALGAMAVVRRKK